MCSRCIVLAACASGSCVMPVGLGARLGGRTRGMPLGSVWVPLGQKRTRAVNVLYLLPVLQALVSCLLALEHASGEGRAGCPRAVSGFHLVKSEHVQSMYCTCRLCFRLLCHACWPWSAPWGKDARDALGQCLGSTWSKVNMCSRCIVLAACASGSCVVPVGLGACLRGRTRGTPSGSVWVPLGQK